MAAMKLSTSGSSDSLGETIQLVANLETCLSAGLKASIARLQGMPAETNSKRIVFDIDREDDGKFKMPADVGLM